MGDEIYINNEKYEKMIGIVKKPKFLLYLW